MDLGRRGRGSPHHCGEEMKRAAIRAFGDWEQAFEFCRELGKPVVVKIISPAEAPGDYRLYPVGYALPVDKNPKTSDKKELHKAQAKALAWFRKESLVTDPVTLAIDLPRAYVHIGSIEAIEYQSDKFDGKARSYRHDVVKHRELYLSPDGSTMIVDPPFKVTTRGIEG